MKLEEWLMNEDEDVILAINDEIQALAARIELLERSIDRILASNEPSAIDVAFRNDYLFKTKDTINGLISELPRRVMMTWGQLSSYPEDGNDD